VSNSDGASLQGEEVNPIQSVPTCSRPAADKPVLLSLGSLQRLVSAKPKEVVLPTDFSTSGNTTEIMPFKLMFQDTLTFRDLQVILLCEKGYPEGKRLESCPRIPQPSEFHRVFLITNLNPNVPAIFLLVHFQQNPPKD